MKFDFKVTTWERYEVPKELEEKVLEMIKTGEITHGSELCDFCDGDANWHNIPEVEEQMTVEENGGGATIEVMDDGEIIFDNAKL